MKRILACILFSMVIGLLSAQNLNSLIAKAENNLEKNRWEQAMRDFKYLVDNHVDDLTYLERANIFNNLGF